MYALLLDNPFLTERRSPREFTLTYSIYIFYILIYLYIDIVIDIVRYLYIIIRGII